ncbi:MAG TPA: hypothetical protein VGQ64_04680 [Candidatus Limnocylindrales bacterium]|nr:hypothetical protein [Candidatus Limnocylindrales bacterium]
MTEGQDPPPERGIWEGLPTKQPSTTVPRWAVPALVIGVACSFVVAWISADYLAGLTRGESPSLAMAYMMSQTPFLLLGVPLLSFGAMGVARPWTARRPWIRIVILVAVIACVIIVLQGPDLFF